MCKRRHRKTVPPAEPLDEAPLQPQGCRPECEVLPLRGVMQMIRATRSQTLVRCSPVLLLGVKEQK